MLLGLSDRCLFRMSSRVNGVRASGVSVVGGFLMMPCIGFFTVTRHLWVAAFGGTSKGLWIGLRYFTQLSWFRPILPREQLLLFPALVPQP